MVQELLSRRLVLVTGKGGVGKTTVAAALAVAAANAGKRVVVCEVDEPSAVGPLLGAAPRGHAPQPTPEGVHVAVLSPDAGIRAYLADRVGSSRIVDLVFDHEAVSRFFRAAPAFPEMGTLYSVWKLLEEKEGGRPRWDHVIVDLPASGHAVAMLSAPSTGRRIFLAGPVRVLCEQMEGMITDHALTACAVVTLPEELPVNEAVELSRKLEDLGVNVQAVLANAVAPEPFSADEAHLIDRLREGVERPLLDGAAVAVRRSARAAAMLRKLAGSLGEAPLPIPFHLVRGRELVRAMAGELTRRRGAPP